MAVESDDLEDEEMELLSYAKMPKFFCKSDMNKSEEVDYQANLLEFYRAHYENFEQERKEYMERIASIEESHEKVHRLEWEIKAQKEEIEELRNALTKANDAQFEYKEKLLQLKAENDSLVEQEMDDRRKIQHLLALTQPVTEEVMFFKDCRPEHISHYPTTGKEEIDSLNLNSEVSRGIKSRRNPALSSQKDAKRTQLPSHSQIKKNSRVLRTVYLPSEQTDSMIKTVDNLREQLCEQKKVFDERLKEVRGDFASRKASQDAEFEKLKDRAQFLEAALTRSENALRSTTKDYLVIRHNAKEAERTAYEEVSALQQKCKDLEDEKKSLVLKLESETKAIHQAIREEGDNCAEEFRQQALSREQDVIILKEQYAAVQRKYNERIQDLEIRLSKLSKRYNELERRRKMEIEGFSRDVNLVKRKIVKIESLYYNTQLSNRERILLRKDKKIKLKPNQLADELSSIKKRFEHLENDINCSNE